ncbi:MAG: CotH kinase family protein [Bacteroidia bacterium]
MRFKNTTLLLLLSLPSFLSAQIRFNEVMNWNTAIEAGQGYQGHCDWIEFQVTEDINLDQWTLSDDPENPKRWAFPARDALSAGEYLVVFADGFDISLHTNFKLKPSGEWIGIFGPDDVIVDSMTLPYIGRNYAYGRNLDTDQWGWYDEPSPGLANETPWYRGLAERPVFSHLPAFFESTQSITIAHDDPQATIRYTFGGDPVHEESPIHASPIVLTNTNVIQAKAYVEGMLPSELVTRTFFVNELAPMIPVLSITTDPANLWDNQIGIYVTGSNGIRDNGPATDPPRNWNQPWEKESMLEYLDAEQEFAFEQKVGIKIFGGWSRAFEQKSLSVFARKEYGENRFHYPFFSEKAFPEYKSFILRNSGNDWSGAGGTMIRDAFQQTFSVGRMEIDHQAYQPTALFLNGEYWGIHNQREKLNENYLYNNHLINEDEVDLLKNDREAFNGNSRNYNEMLDFVKGHPMNFEYNYELAKQMIDMQEFMDYQILQIYINNQDWPGNNIKFWRAHAPGSRWRWLLYDTDFGFGIWGSQPTENTLSFALEQFGPGWPNPPWATQLFRSLSESPDFRREFAQRYLSQINYNFTPDRVNHFTDSLSQNIDVAIRHHFTRWGGQYFTWLDLIKRMQSFGQVRPQYARQHLRSGFGLGGEVQMRIWWPDNEQGGSVKEQSYRMQDGVLGNYFTKLPLNLQALPDRGFEFKGWALYPWPSDSLPPAENAKLYGMPRFDQTLDSSRWIRPQFVPLDVKIGSLALGAQNTEIGLYNPTEQTQYLSGYRLQGSVDTVLASGTILEAGAWLSLRIDVPLDTFTLMLRHPIGYTVDSLTFKQGYWPGGDTYHLRHPQLNNTDASNWRSVPRDQALKWESWLSDLKINELVADNVEGIRDEEKEAADWLEIHNPSDRLVDIGGMYLTDDLDRPYRWQIPMDAPLETTILSDGYLRLWADGDSSDGPLHLPFKLSKGGETIYLYERGGLLVDSLAYPALGQDSAYARSSNTNIVGMIIPLITTTPAGPNVFDNQKPVFTSEALREASPQKTYRYQATTSDPNGDQIWQEVISLPQWAFYSTSTNGSGTISGTPQKTDIGEHLVILRAWDGFTQSHVYQSFTIVIRDPAEERVLTLANKEGILFPNPTEGLISYMAVYEPGTNLKVKIVDTSGREVWTKEYISSAEIWRQDIDLSALSAGIYLFQVWEGEQLMDWHKVLVK